MDKKWGSNKQYGSRTYKESQFEERSPVGSPTAAETLAEYLLISLGKDDGTLVVTQQELGPDHIKVTATCDPLLTGRLIGKGGRTISAVRYVVRAIAESHGKRVDIEVASLPSEEEETAEQPEP